VESRAVLGYFEISDIHTPVANVGSDLEFSTTEAKPTAEDIIVKEQSSNFD
jgi:hypothetical protein